MQIFQWINVHSVVGFFFNELSIHYFCYKGNDGSLYPTEG